MMSDRHVEGDGHFIGTFGNEKNSRAPSHHSTLGVIPSTRAPNVYKDHIQIRQREETTTTRRPSMSKGGTMMSDPHTEVEEQLIGTFDNEDISHSSMGVIPSTRAPNVYKDHIQFRQREEITTTRRPSMSKGGTMMSDPHTEVEEQLMGTFDNEDISHSSMGVILSTRAPNVYKDHIQFRQREETTTTRPSMSKGGTMMSDPHTEVEEQLIGTFDNEDISHSSMGVLSSIRGARIRRQPAWFQEEEETNSNIGDTIDSDTAMENDELETSTIPCTTKRKGRGPTGFTGTKPPKGTKWKCVMVNGQPVGKSKKKLAKLLGLRARDARYFLVYLESEHQHIKGLEDAMTNIFNHYEFIDEEDNPVDWELVVRYCNASLGKKLRKWRCRLKKLFEAAKTDDQRKQRPNGRIQQEHWEQLIHFWETERKKVQSKKNTEARLLKRMIHTTGARSFAEYKYKMKMQLGDQYSTIGAFIAVHQRKDGNFVGEDTAVICVVDRVDEEDLVHCSDPSILCPILDDVHGGHHGVYERFVGLGYSRALWKDTLGTQARRQSQNMLQSKLHIATKELTSVQEQNKLILEDNMLMKEKLNRLEGQMLEMQGSGVGRRASEMTSRD